MTVTVNDVKTTVDAYLAARPAERGALAPELLSTGGCAMNRRVLGATAVRGGPGALEVVAVTLLLVGGLLAGIGWIAGVILLWSSPRWRWSDKLLGTLVWPGGLVGVLLLVEVLFVLPMVTLTGTTPFMIAHCTHQAAYGTTPASVGCSGDPTWLYWAGLAAAALLLLGTQIAVAVRLVRRSLTMNEALSGDAL